MRQNHTLISVSGLLLFFLNIVPVHAQILSSSHYTISGQIRHRFELSDKSFTPDTKSTSFNLLRTRLGVRLNPLKNTELFVQAQDSRTFGENQNTLTGGSGDLLAIHQAYFKITNILKAPIDVRVVGFEAKYGTERLVGAEGWHNIGRSFDGFLVRFHPEDIAVDIFNMKISEKLNSGDDNDLNFLGMYADIQFVEHHTVQFYTLWQRGNELTELNQYTFGTYLSKKTGDFRHSLEAAYQAGNASNIKVAAFMVAVTASFTVKAVETKPVFSVGIDVLSGDDNNFDGTRKVFDTFYATNHNFYGFMDYFLHIPAHTAGLGLTDIHSGVDAKPIDKVGIGLVYHHFTTSEDQSGGKKGLGDEIDVTLKFNYNKKVALIGGTSFFLPAKGMFDPLNENDNGSWFYLMSIVNF